MSTGARDSRRLRGKLTWLAALAIVTCSTPAQAQREGPMRFERHERRARTPPRKPVAPVVPTEYAYTGGAIPDGYRLDERSSPALAWTGGIMFGVTYGFSFLLGASFSSCSPEPSDDSSCVLADFGPKLMIPVVGPALIWAGCEGRDCHGNPAMLLFLADSLLQTAGVTMFLVGNRKRQVLVRDKPAAVSLSLGPSAVPGGGGGMMAWGRF